MQPKWSIVKNTLLAAKKSFKAIYFSSVGKKNAICHIHFFIVWCIAIHE